MRFASPPPSPRREAIVPMINVVFLLLIFFMMTSQITSPPPLEVTPPSGEAAEMADAANVLWIDADGSVAYQGVTGDAVWSMLSAMPEGETLLVSADGALPAKRLAALLGQIGGRYTLELTVQN